MKSIQLKPDTVKIIQGIPVKCIKYIDNPYYYCAFYETDCNSIICIGGNRKDNQQILFIKL